jgi:D-alanyl-D-alanine carboxypeptidase
VTTKGRRFAFLFLLLLSAAAFAQPAPKAETPLATRISRAQEAVRAALEAAHAENGFPGANFAFVVKDQAPAAVSVGLSHPESKRALAPTDRMLAGSIGKTFVAAVALQLAESGRLELDAPISKWLGKEPWFERLPNAKDITIRMLMNHSSGVPEHVQLKEFNDAFASQPDKVWKPVEMLAYIFDHKPLFPAGQGWSYADTNYVVLGIIVERITGERLFDSVMQRVVKPLGLKHSTPSDSRDIAGLIPGDSTMMLPHGRTIQNGRYVINPQFEWAGGGMVSTAADLAAWAKALYGGRVLKPATVEMMVDAVPARTGPGDRYGLGVQVRQTPCGITYGHGGWFPGYLSEVFYFPEHGVAMAIQFNTDDRAKLKKSARRYLTEMSEIVLKGVVNATCAPPPAAK